jgi:hypothetical protein
MLGWLLPVNFRGVVLGCLQALRLSGVAKQTSVAIVALETGHNRWKAIDIEGQQCCGGFHEVYTSRTGPPMPSARPQRFDGVWRAGGVSTCPQKEADRPHCV